jgi:hypothetical protein
MLKLIKMAKKKKDLNIDIDTKNIDVKVTRKGGEFHAEFDGKHIDVTIDKDENGTTIDIEGDGVISEKILNGLKKLGRLIKSKRG